MTDPWVEGLEALSRYYVGGATLQETLQRVSDLAVATVPGAEYLGITMLVEGQQRTAIFTDPEAVEIDQAQYDSGHGPCVDAFRDGVPYLIESTKEEGEWPEFRQTAAAHGILSTMSMPMIVEGAPVGAMNFYASAERAFPAQVIEKAEPFVAQASIALANAQVYWDATQLGARLTDAIEYRGVIEQAKGILMANHPCGPDEAHQMLVAASQRENLKVREIAQRIVDETINRDR
jgi:GAF domain-containing protein